MTYEGTSVPPSSPCSVAGSNVYGVQTDGITLSRLTGPGVPALDALKAEVTFLFQVCGSKKPYRGTVLPIQPHVPVIARMLDVGSNDAAVERIQADYAEGRLVEDAQRKQFGNLQESFHGWQQWGSIAAHSCGKEPVLFATAAPPPPPPPAPSFEKPPTAAAELDETATPAEDTAADDGESSECPSVFNADADVPLPLPPPLLPPVLNIRPLVLQETPFHQVYVPRFIPGVLDDHFFLLAVAATTCDRALFTLPFADLSYASRGMVICRFFTSSNTAEFVIVDTLLPTAKATASATAPADLHLAIGRTDHSNEFWLALLEKAYATFQKSYSALNGGNTATVLQHLTAGQPQYAQWSAPSVAPRAKDHLWWAMKECTRQLAPMVATRAADIGATPLPPSHEAAVFGCSLPSGNWRDGVAVLCVAEYDKTQELAHLDPYLRMRERRLRAQNLLGDDEPIRLVKVRSVFPTTSHGNRHAWRRTSSNWTQFATRDLQYDAESRIDADEALVWWLTLDEFVATYDVLLCMKSVEGSDAKALLHHIAPMASRDLIPIASPHYLLTVSKSDAGAQDSGLNDAVDCKFATIHALVPPPVAFGDESDDEDPKAGAGGKSSAGETDVVRSNGLRLEVRLSLPSVEHQKRFSVLVFRAPSAGRIKPVKLLRDDAICYHFPTFGRVEVKPMSSTIGSKEVTYFFEAVLSPGFYNLVVAVDLEKTGVTDAITTDTPLEVSCILRDNGDAFNLRFETLP